MNRYAHVFEELRDRNEGAFVPFTVLGDPDPESSLGILEAFVAGGADMLELGIPFSDPVADGPVIQAADNRALEAGVTPTSALAIVSEFRRRHPRVPVGLLIYANLVVRPGMEVFARRMASSGVDSVLVADMPMEESGPLRRATAAAGVGAVAMATPLSREDRLASFSRLDAPYIYVVSRRGVTGKDSSLSTSARPLLRRVRSACSAPTLLGFGISRPEHVREALSAGADGAISGSAIAEIISTHVGSSPGPISARKRRALCSDIEAFVRAMKASTHQGAH